MVLTYSVSLSRLKWMKFLSWKKLRDFKEGMKNWHSIGTKHTKQVMNLVKAAETAGKELDEDIGSLIFSHT